MYLLGGLRRQSIKAKRRSGHTNLLHSDFLEGAARRRAASFGAEPYKEQPAFQGYSWYDRLSLLCNTAVLLDGLPYEEWKHPERERPKRMEIEVVVNSPADGERKLLLPALIHVDSESINEPTFVAVADSPWDGDSQPGPFSVTDFLMWATFSSSDEFGECDSWERQREEYQRVIESTVNEYFGGPRAALLTLLRDAIPWDAHAYLDRLGIRSTIAPSRTYLIALQSKARNSAVSCCSTTSPETARAGSWPNAFADYGELDWLES